MNHAAHRYPACRCPISEPCPYHPATTVIRMTDPEAQHVAAGQDHAAEASQDDPAALVFRPVKVITWHYREQPDLGDIRNALADIGGGYLYPADTECDDFAVIISKIPMTQQIVNIAYRKHAAGG